MKKYYVKLKHYLKQKYFWEHFFAAIAALSAATTLLTVLFNLDIIKRCVSCGVLGTVMVLIGSFAYALWQSRRTKRIDVRLSPQKKLTIEEGDLFDSNNRGVICIPVNEYFDTHVGDDVIEPTTIHGRFINHFFKDHIQDLDNKIQEQLLSISPIQENVKRRLSDCPDKKYELGTCIEIQEGGNIYVLFALTHFDEEDKASVSNAEYTKVVQDVLNYLHKHYEKMPIYIPLFGTTFSRIRRTPRRLLFHFVDTLDFDDSNTFIDGLNIVIDSLDATCIDLPNFKQILEQFFKL